MTVCMSIHLPYWSAWGSNYPPHFLKYYFYKMTGITLNVSNCQVFAWNLSFWKQQEMYIMKQELYESSTVKLTLVQILTPGTHRRRKHREGPFLVWAATSTSTLEAHFSTPVNKLLCSSAPLSSNIELCVCACVCRSLLTDRYIYRQDNHAIIKQGVLFWHLFYFKNWPDSLCLFSVSLPVKCDLLSSALFSLTKGLAARGKIEQTPKLALQSALRRSAPRRCSECCVLAVTLWLVSASNRVSASDSSSSLSWDGPVYSTATFTAIASSGLKRGQQTK